MDMIIFEDRIKYDAWIKVLLVLGVVSLVLLGVLFYLDAQGSEVFRGAPAAESRTSSGLLFAAAVFSCLSIGSFSHGPLPFLRRGSSSNSAPSAGRSLLGRSSR
jgi:formate hydrogenlyase subunit 3/multisubunit Na+/H+ antiporter MnhD subunit